MIIFYFTTFSLDTSLEAVGTETHFTPLSSAEVKNGGATFPFSHRFLLHVR